MPATDRLRSGVPCRIDSFQPDPSAAAQFYAALLGWAFDPPQPQDGSTAPVRHARLDGRLVASIGPAPEGLPSAVWSTSISVDDVDAAIDRATAHGATVMAAPTEHPGEGRLAILIDPTGVAFGLWQAEGVPGADIVDVPGAWAMSSLHTPSLEASAAFYGAVFGWELATTPPSPMGLWRLPGYTRPQRHPHLPDDLVGVAVPIAPGEPTPPHWSVGLLVADVDATVSRAQELGGTVLFGPIDTPQARSAAIADPQGGVVSINQRS
jgi:predicted enzyme related to lactoylglutathione lyase